MKNFLVGLLLLTPFSVLAEGQIVDPDKTPTWTITCEYPVEREDGTPLAINEIAKVEFYVSPDKSDWISAGENTTACRQVYNLTDVADGQYYYTVTATDTEGRASLFSINSPDANIDDPGYVALVVKRVKPPKPAMGLSGEAS
jgi:hypothetical protein